jgi:hypothetical protein
MVHSTTNVGIVRNSVPLKWDRLNPNILKFIHVQGTWIVRYCVFSKSRIKMNTSCMKVLHLFPDSSLWIPAATDNEPCKNKHKNVMLMCLLHLQHKKWGTAITTRKLCDLQNASKTYVISALWAITTRFHSN